MSSIAQKTNPGSKNKAPYRQWLADRNRTHGLSCDDSGRKTRLYGIWVRMRQRCRDAKSSDYERYGGRGIEVCAEWNDFEAFSTWSHGHGYTEAMTIDRIDNDGPYIPQNCRWIPPAMQQCNTRRSRRINFRGVTHTLAEWSRCLGIGHSLLRYRIAAWGVDQAFTRPIRGRR
jgi:hypothetical protein